MSTSPAGVPVREPSSPGDLFLNYNSKDHVAVQRSRTLLEGRGISVFLDRESLIVGLNWFDALQQELGRVRAVAVILGPNGLGDWQRREITLAMVRQTSEETPDSSFPVIPMLRSLSTQWLFGRDLTNGQSES
jgi:hypothetical protein